MSEQDLGPDNAFWDDGEWVSCNEINSTLYKLELKERFPLAEPGTVKAFYDLLEAAQDYQGATGRPAPLYGELGELFVEISYGLKRHKPNAAGSDGRIGNDFVEVKTISPEKSKLEVQVKRQGNFNKLIVVRICPYYSFEARMLERAKMPKGDGKLATAVWGESELCWA